MKKILVTGSDGRFAKVLKKTKSRHKFLFLNKKELNILNFNNIFKIVKKIKPKYILHLAALSRPMSIHDKFISETSDLISQTMGTEVLSPLIYNLIMYLQKEIIPFA